MTRWRPIKTAKKNGQRILLKYPLWHGFSSDDRVTIGSWDAWNMRWDDNLYNRNPKEAPTHWQPLPKP